MVNNKVKYRLGKTNYWGEARERRVRCGERLREGGRRGRGYGGKGEELRERAHGRESCPNLVSRRREKGKCEERVDGVRMVKQLGWPTLRL